MEHFPKAMIILILLLNDRIVMNLSHEDWTLWAVYITIGNLDSKTWQNQIRLATLLLGPSTLFMSV